MHRLTYIGISLATATVRNVTVAEASLQKCDLLLSFIRVFDQGCISLDLKSLSNIRDIHFWSIVADIMRAGTHW
jgi:hypothetical protein